MKQTTKQLKKENSNLIMFLVIVFLVSVLMVVVFAAELRERKEDCKLEVNQTKQECKLEVNQTYTTGYNAGVEFWNGIVIYKLQENKIPYFWNGTYNELNIRLG